MAIKKHDFIELEYTGKVAPDGPIFDTTNQAIAQKEGLDDGHHHWGSRIVCVGEGHMLPGLDKELEGKVPGKYTITLKDADGFGKKSAKLLKMIPGSQFKKQNIQPQVGLELTIDEMRGTIRSVSGGRVIVDFNHPLASRDLIYEVTILRIVTDVKAQIEALTTIFHLHNAKVSIVGDKASLELIHAIPSPALKPFTDMIIRLTKVKTVEYKTPETAEKPDAKPKKKA